MLRDLRYWWDRRQYDRYMQNERRKIDALAAIEPWTCDRCGLVQSGEGRSIRKWWEGYNHPGGKPRADFVAMSCWECHAPIIRTVSRDA